MYRTMSEYTKLDVCYYAVIGFMYA